MKIATIFRFPLRLNYAGTDRSKIVICATESRETRDHFHSCAPELLNALCYSPSQPLYIAGIPHEVAHGGIAFETLEDFLAAWKMKLV